MVMEREFENLLSIIGWYTRDNCKYAPDGCDGCPFNDPEHASCIRWEIRSVLIQHGKNPLGTPQGGPVARTSDGATVAEKLDVASRMLYNEAIRVIASMRDGETPLDRGDVIARHYLNEARNARNMIAEITEIGRNVEKLLSQANAEHSGNMSTDSN